MLQLTSIRECCHFPPLSMTVYSLALMLFFPGSLAQEAFSARQQDLGRSWAALALTEGDSYHSPGLRLSNAVALPTQETQGMEATQFLLEPLASLSLTASDFDEDGVTDLVLGFRSPEGGFVRIHRGNADYLFPDTDAARRSRQEGRYEDNPFLSHAQTFLLSEAPDFLEGGDFDADGHKDLLVAQRHSARLWFLSGNADGSFDAGTSIDLQGGVTTLSVGEVNRADGLEDLVVGVSDEAGTRLLIFQGSAGALNSEPSIVGVPEPVTGIAFERLDEDSLFDIAFNSGAHLGVIYGIRDTVGPASAPEVEWHDVEGQILSIVAADFASDHRNELAVLLSDGRIQILRHTDSGLQVLNDFPAPEGSVGLETRLARARTFNHVKDDLLVINSDGGSFHYLVGDKGRNLSLADSEAAGRFSFFARDGVPAALSIRVNRDAFDDLVFLQQETLTPAFFETQSTGFIVDSEGDEPDETKGDGQCRTEGGLCTLRAAIEEVNAGNGSSITFTEAVNLIVLASGLPLIVNPVNIDGGESRVEIEGVGPQVLGIRGGSSTITRLILNGALVGISIAGGEGNVVTGCWIGIARDGTAKPNSGDGIRIYSSGNRIGGLAQAERNIVSGNGSAGILVSKQISSGPEVTGNKIYGNYFGMDPTGKKAVPNGTVAFPSASAAGILISEATNTLVGGPEASAGNLISGNLGAGVSVVFAIGTKIQGNKIGVDKDEAADNPVGNSVDGIVLAGPGTQIGGTTSAMANVIGGNGSNDGGGGIRLQFR